MTIERYLASQESLPLSCDAVGATATSPPDHFVIDRTRVLLGQGEDVYLRACESLRSWDHFRLGWVTVFPQPAPLVVGQIVAVTVGRLGCWWLNACRIVELIDDKPVERNATHRFGFAYGTLPGHAERGEERFLVEWNCETDEVHYDILAFSQPRHWLARLGYPMVRRLQKQFGRDSAIAMVRAVSILGLKPQVSQQTG